MGSTINVNYMSNMTNQYAKAFSKKVTSDASRSGSMADAIKKLCSDTSAENTSNISKTMETESVSKVEMNSDKSIWSGDMEITLEDMLRGASHGITGENRSKDEMTMDEYKQWFMNETSRMSVSGWMRSNFSSATVVIKDEAFERMKKDPEYEEYVLNRIKSFYSASGLNTGMENMAYEVIGASPEECYGYAGPVGGSGSERINNKDKSWWEKRHEKMEELIREQAEAAQRKRIAEREAIQREYNNSRIENDHRLQTLISEQAQRGENTTNPLPTIGQMVAATEAYETSFITSDFG